MGFVCFDASIISRSKERQGAFFGKFLFSRNLKETRGDAAPSGAYGAPPLATEILSI